MEQTRNRRGVAARGERESRVHAGRISFEQFLYLGTLLIVLAAPLSASDIDFDPSITQDEFHAFSALMGQVLYATPVDAARSESLLGFDVGVMATGIEVDEDASWWVDAVGDDFSSNGYVFAPRIVASKGLGFANVSASYGRISDSDMELLAGSIDVPILRGSLVTPTIAVRGAYSTLRGVDEFDLQTYGAEVFISKSFGPITPYAGAGITRVEATGRITADEPAPIPIPDLQDEFEQERFTLGIRLSLLVPKIVVEVTQGEERSYAAKVSLGI